MECKEEISDSDSGIILNSGPDSPTSPVKDLSTHTRALRLKHQSLEDRLELCLLELKKLCIREAELTGKLSSDFPLLPDEKPPQIRRRIGAAFKLDEDLIAQDGEESELHVLEADLALHRQIYEAARRLSLEEHISKPVRKSRMQQCKREEKKVKEMQEAVLKHRINHGCVSPQTCRSSRKSDLCISDDSSLSDAVALDDDLELSPLSPTALDRKCSFQRPVTLTLSPSHNPKEAGSSSSLEYERCPIQNTPWKESSLDQPYQKNKKPPSASSSRSSSPTGTLSDQRLDDIPPAPQFVFKSLAMRNNNSTSAPSTPELPLRRHISQSFRLPRPKPDLCKPISDLNRVRTKLPRRRVTDFALAYSVQRLYQCSSEDSSSEHSISSYSSSSSRESAPDTAKACPPPYGYHCAPQSKAQGQQAPKNLPKNNLLRPVISSSKANNQERMLLEGEMSRLNLALTLPANPGNLNKPQQVETTSPKRTVKPPPPPYSRLARAPSLREYPNHPSRLLPRDVVANDLKSWHQKNIAGQVKPQPFERHGSMRIKRMPNQEPPSYHQVQALRLVPQKVILQRDSDGTPLQWYEEEGCEIVSQV